MLNFANFFFFKFDHHPAISDLALRRLLREKRFDQPMTLFAVLPPRPLLSSAINNCVFDFESLSDFERRMINKWRSATILVSVRLVASIRDQREISENKTGSSPASCLGPCGVWEGDCRSFGEGGVCVGGDAFDRSLTALPAFACSLRLLCCYLLIRPDGGETCGQRHSSSTR